jgi:hypothetical protein
MAGPPWCWGVWALLSGSGTSRRTTAHGDEAPRDSTGTKISGQSEAAIKLESDKAVGDPPGVFTFTNGTATGTERC